ncbi:MAG: septum formation protein Maf [Bdellovibrionales bacterium]|nr:septum formation protein Maf [Bdellovibrionales bacterium]
MKQHCTVILGSKSPRRKELLMSWGLLVKTMEPVEPETASTNDPSKFVLEIAQAKMDSLQEKIPQDAACVTADTIVHLDQNILGKPKDVQDAKKMMQMLSGTSHYVSTAYVIQYKKQISRVVQTKVHMKTIDASLLELYLQQAQVLDKAGAYGIQEHAGFFVESIEGSLTNVIGLPLYEIFQDLESLAIISK